ncbi:MAG: NAD(P)-binding domain-containing protein, partial [Neisseriaceae bacterium]|nr:NAD(P)-binding domain-containing protein [Neisseriaceae bacterium]
MGTEQKITVAVLGTGVMGAPMARHLHQQGFVVRVWNRSGAKAQALALAHPGIQACDHPLQAVMGADIVVTMLKDAQGVAEVMNAAAPALREGCVWLQMSTVGLAGIADLAALAAK